MMAAGLLRAVLVTDAVAKHRPERHFEAVQGPEEAAETHQGGGREAGQVIEPQGAGHARRGLVWDEGDGGQLRAVPVGLAPATVQGLQVHA